MSRSYQSSGDDGKDDVLNALKVKFTIPDSKMWRDKNRKRKVSAFLLPDGGGFTVYVESMATVDRTRNGLVQFHDGETEVDRSARTDVSFLLSLPLLGGRRPFLTP